MRWTSWLFLMRSAASLDHHADRITDGCEEWAWTLVERRALWLSPRELRGYIRARTRARLEQEVARRCLQSPELARRTDQLIVLVADRLLDRVIQRASMAQALLPTRLAA